jgi:hypothetical protein
MKTYYELVCAPRTDERGHMYYGVDRPFCWVQDRPWEETPARAVWEEWVTSNYEVEEKWDSFFPSLDLARDFQERFHKHGYSFGIIAIHPCGSPEEAASIEKLPGYLGLDVSTGEPESFLYPSALWDDLDYEAHQDRLLVLWALPPKYFRSRVNHWGLLSSYEDAVLLQYVMRALRKIEEPDLPLDIHVLGIQEIAS